MVLKTLCTRKKGPIYGLCDSLHWHKGLLIGASRQFVLAKRPQCMGWGHFALAKRLPSINMGTHRHSKMATIYGHWDTLQ